MHALVARGSSTPRLGRQAQSSGDQHGMHMQESRICSSRVRARGLALKTTPTNHMVAPTKLTAQE